MPANTDEITRRLEKNFL